MQHPIWAALLHQLRDSRQQAIPLDAAVYDHVTDMNVLGSIFARNALREIAQRCLRGCEGRKVRLATQASRGTSEKQRPAAMLEEYGNRGLGQLIATERVLTPMAREALFADLQKRRRFVAAGVVNGDSKWGGLICFGDKASDIPGACGIADGN